MKRKTNIIIIIIFCLIIFSYFTYTTLGKYANREDWIYTIKTGNIYIFSDKLSTQNVNHYLVYENKPIEFNVYNYANKELISSTNIKYSLECSTSNQDVSCIIDGGVINDEYILKSECDENKKCNEKSNIHTIEIINNGEENIPVDVKVQLNTTSPYQKKLSATFRIQDYIDKNYEYTFIKENEFCCYYKIENISNKEEFDITSNLYFRTTSSNDLAKRHEITIPKGDAKVIEFVKPNDEYDCGKIDTTIN